MLSGVAADGEVLRLDTDEHVPRPVTRDELRATVARLDDRKAVMEVVETYLTLVARKRSLEDRTDGEREDDDRYREVVSELAGRRRQITGLLSRLAEPSAESPQSPGDRGDTGPDRTATGPDQTVTGRGERGGRFPPLYLSRKSGFYGMWLVAALTYGVGDVLSTTYAVITVPGLIEGNPVVDTLLANFGLGGFLVFKLLVFLVLISISVQGARSRERFSYYWPPMVMSVLGVALTAWNLRLILGG